MSQTDITETDIIQGLQFIFDFGNVAEKFEYGLNAAAIKFDGKHKYIRITDINENGTLNETYNQYLFIRTLEKLADKGDLPQIIYVPTNGMLPVMDVSKKSPVKQMQQSE